MGLPAMKTFMVVYFDAESMEQDAPKLQETMVNAHYMAPDAGGTLSFFVFEQTGGQVLANRIHTFRVYEEAFRVEIVQDEPVPAKTILAGGFN
jgi:hypothetical protein